jgi:hypothetical protein
MTSRSRERLEQLAAGVGEHSDLAGDRVVRNQNERDIPRTATRERGVFNGTTKKLSVNTEIPGYQLRWFNDQDGRVEAAVGRAWWDFVTQDEVALQDSNKVLERNSDVGSRVRAIVGTLDNGDPLYAYLLKIKKEWFDEDQQSGAKQIRDSEKEMMKNGGLNTERIAEKYIPDERKRALDMKLGEFRQAG